MAFPLGLCLGPFTLLLAPSAPHLGMGANHWKARANSIQEPSSLHLHASCQRVCIFEVPSDGFVTGFLLLQWAWERNGTQSHTIHTIHTYMQSFNEVQTLLSSEWHQSKAVAHPNAKASFSMPKDHRRKTCQHHAFLQSTRQANWFVDYKSFMMPGHMLGHGKHMVYKQNSSNKGSKIATHPA